VDSAAQPARCILVQADDFDVPAEIARVSGAGNVGAVVSFTGLCRDEEGALAALELEHYPGMAEEEIGRVVDDACTRWPLMGVTVIHRHGLIRPGETIVLVVTASAHRRAAFESADFLMDFLKTRAPFWKKEHLVNGASRGWVDAKAEDAAASARWG
jgi:molybdopterin synthase catalytic subunit